MILETRYLKDFLHNIANMEKFLIHVSNLFLAKNFLLRFLRKKKLTGAQWFRMLKNRTKREKMKSSLV